MNKLLSLRADNRTFLALLLLLAIFAIGGGSSRADVDSLIFLRPLAMVALGFGIYSIRREDYRQYRLPLLLLLTAIAIVFAHLIPLPPGVWGSMPGRELIVKVTELTETPEVWRPLAMVPWRAYNTLFALCTALAVFILVIQQADRKLMRLLPILIGVATISALLSLFQIIGPLNGPLYLYDMTNPGAPVGLFANRNHQALLLAMLIPMCAAFAAQRVATIENSRRRVFISLACLALVIPLLLVSRSRAGLVVALFGVIASALVYLPPRIERKARRRRLKINPLILPSVGIFVVLIAGFFLTGRSTGLDKFAETDAVDGVRTQIWNTTLEAIGAFMPLGSGVGSFVETYQIFEKREELSIYYINHAHNDFLEVALVAGIPGIMLLGGMLGVIVVAAFRVFTRRPEGEGRDMVILGRAGAVMLAQLGAASLVDYPIRTPLISALAMIAFVWLWRGCAWAERGDYPAYVKR